MFSSVRLIVSHIIYVKLALLRPTPLTRLSPAGLPVILGAPHYVTYKLQPIQNYLAELFSSLTAFSLFQASSPATSLAIPGPQQNSYQVGHHDI